MAEFAPGMRVIIRDEEWMIRKCDPNSYNTYTLQCVGVSPLVRDKTSYFLSDLEKITVIDPAKTALIPDHSARFTRSRLFLESQWRQKIPTDTKLHVGHHAVMDVMPYQLEPAAIPWSLMVFQQRNGRVDRYGQKASPDIRYMVTRSSNEEIRGDIGCVVPPGSGHIMTLYGIAFNDLRKLMCITASFSSLPYDFYLKSGGKSHIGNNTFTSLPYLYNIPDSAIVRSLLLNCLTDEYAMLWREEYSSIFTNETWTKPDPRLSPSRFTNLSPEWTWDTPLRTDYERRQALVEIDVLTAMTLGMTLDQLKTIYRIQFPVLQQYEADTWYDANGRIVFTTNRGLTGVGFSRTEWENSIKNAPAGKSFYRTITDDTQPGGPVQRTIEYVAPFDRCDREKDYETAWEFFSK